MTPHTTIQQNLHKFQQELHALQAKKQCQHQTVLVAVSKFQPVQAITAALTAGHTIFGENRVQEAAEKWPTLKQLHPSVKLHLIGALQTNKAKQAIELFDTIETLDREKLAKTLHTLQENGANLPALYIQVNTGEEPQKSGVSPTLAAEFITYCRSDLKLPIQGLMCIPPTEDNPSLHFALLAKLCREHHLPHCSMGMSSDWHYAVPLGATAVRLGSAIFGERTPN